MLYRKNLNFKNVLIAGGAGFIGSHLVEALVEAGCNVPVIDNLPAGRLSNLATVRTRIKFYQGDFRDPRLLNPVLTDCEVLFHLAAIVSVPWTVENPVESAAVNEMGPRQVPSSPYSGVISIFMSRAVAELTPVIYGNGKQYRDFVFVKDLEKGLHITLEWYRQQNR